MLKKSYLDFQNEFWAHLGHKLYNENGVIFQLDFFFAALTQNSWFNHTNCIILQCKKAFENQNDVRNKIAAQIHQLTLHSSKI